MKIKFKNGSSIESIGDESDAKRSQRGEDQLARMSDQIQYWQHNTDKKYRIYYWCKAVLVSKVWVKLRRRNK